MDKTLPKLKGREKDIMLIIWHSDHPLTASDIAATEEKLSINTVQPNLKKLVKKGYIKISGVTYRGTVLSRLYEALISPEHYAAIELQNMQNNTLNFSTFNFLNYLIKDDIEVLDNLEEIIKRKKNQVKD